MGFLDRLKKSQNSAMSQWKTLTSLEQLNDIDKDSKGKPVVLFKHSTTCGISAGAKHRIEIDWTKLEGEVMDFYYLDLLNYRPISNAIAERYNVRHESPQIIVVKNGKATFNTSHHRINADAVKSAL